MSVTWTKNQKDAIDARGTSLMVSAAAGSGKTSVLTQRIVSLLSEKNGPSASRLAVVTFTKAAAKNLEDKLYRALSDLVAKNPENTALSRQLMGLSSAQISTIHSFCYNLIRAYRKELGLRENLMIADEDRISVLKEKAVEEAVEEFLRGAGEKKEVRHSLCRIFGTARSLAGLYDALFILLDKVSFLPGGIDSLFEKCDELEKEVALLENKEITLSQSAVGKEVGKEGISLFTKGEETLAALIAALENTQVISEKYLPFFEERRLVLKLCRVHMEQGDFFSASKCLKDGFETPLPRILKCPPEEKETKEQVSEIHNRTKKSLLTFSLSHLEKPLPEILAETRESLALTREFLVLGSLVIDKFALKKEEKGFLDYADLENFALRLVAEKKDGVWQKSKLGEKITEEFDAVFVDEYQDSNAIQDLIFRCVTKKDNLFIVGDPKQSIYRFRGAEPEIFSHYKNTLERYPSASDKMQTIFLSDNFRSSGTIIDLVNRIFRKVMDAAAPDSLYKEEDELRQGAKDEKDPLCTEIVLMKKEEEEEREVFSDAAQLIQEENIEAKYIAARIRSLLSEYEPREIAVICRTHRQISLVRASLENLNIECNCPGGFLPESDPEYLFVHSLILALDNPDNDIPLLGALLSPVFRFSSDDLFAIRKLKQEKSFYSALRFAAESESHPLREKCREAVKTLLALREKTKVLTLPALIFHLYRELSVEEIFGKKGCRIKNFFLTSAENAESVGEYALSDFADYLSLRAEKGDEEEDTGLGVNLMTIHKSKGLEFPVVFASFLAQKFDRRDETSKLIFSPEQGLVFHLPKEGGRIRQNSFIRKGAALYLRHAALEEEKRVLYVA
ncbi:MAG: UvrD-helicase domain-containing protein, partial [Clostridia bacterium]|nr:UvrD-helicase domain-containing protein [Clostridia bacterium]